MKFKGKEAQRQEFSDGSGLEWLDFGARMYDNQTGRWQVVDPLAGMYEDISPYAFVKNNPVNNIELDGRYFEGQNEEKARKYRKMELKKADKLDKKADRLEKKGKDVGDLRSRSEELRKSARDINDMAADDKNEYRWESANSNDNPAGKGNPLTTGKDKNGNNVLNKDGNQVINMFTRNDMGSIIHESRHGGQNARGTIDAVNQNEKIWAEVSSFRAEFSWSSKLTYAVFDYPQMTDPVNMARVQLNIVPSDALRKVNSINQINSELVRSMGEIRQVMGQLLLVPMVYHNLPE